MLCWLVLLPPPPLLSSTLSIPSRPAHRQTPISASFSLSHALEQNSHQHKKTYNYLARKKHKHKEQTSKDPNRKKGTTRVCTHFFLYILYICFFPFSHSISLAPYLVFVSLASNAYSTVAVFLRRAGPNPRIGSDVESRKGKKKTEKLVLCPMLFLSRPLSFSLPVSSCPPVVFLIIHPPATHQKEGREVCTYAGKENVPCGRCETGSHAVERLRHAVERQPQEGTHPGGVRPLAVAPAPGRAEGHLRQGVLCPVRRARRRPVRGGLGDGAGPQPQHRGCTPLLR